jgi:hypothetical protein
MMTNSTSASMHTDRRNYARLERKSSDTAPMVITRLSGWIEVGELAVEPRSWIIPTRVAHTAR